MVKILEGIIEPLGFYNTATKEFSNTLLYPQPNQGAISWRF